MLVFVFVFGLLLVLVLLLLWLLLLLLLPFSCHSSKRIIIVRVADSREKWSSIVMGKMCACSRAITIATFQKKKKTLTFPKRCVLLLWFSSRKGHISDVTESYVAEKSWKPSMFSSF